MDALSISADAGLTGEATYPPPRRAWMACSILALGSILAFMDRGILSLFVVPIQRDLHLSDTEIGALIGMAFGVFNAIFGLPIGRLVDVGNRKVIAAAGVFAWSAANAACGLAGNFAQMFVARTAVGAGEGALSPASVSLLADYFPPGRRGLPMGVFYSGMHIGGGGVLLLGGLIWLSFGDRMIDLPLLGALHSWQVIILCFAGLGLIVAPLTLAIPEPPRIATHRADQAGGSSFRETLRFYDEHRGALVGHNVGFVFSNFALHAGAAWLPAILMRSQGWTLTQTGSIYGTILLVVSPVGAISGGLLGDRLVKAGHRDGRLIAAVVAACGLGLAGLCIGFAHSPWLVVAGLLVFTFFSSFNLPLGPGALQDGLPNKMRGQGIALYIFCINIIAGGIAAVMVGAMTQYVFKDPTRTSEAFALIAVVVCTVAAIVLNLARPPFRTLVATQIRPN
ncbi:MFS transporter [Sphingomonas sp. CL5.1]|uniref:MFS transporter n=1 Tax=Sphingomonas sp. CL5.1 TaxID=2653203 RepID=UPI0015819390|nr:MFS transporter [Sphingomonas sp. CL5.1]QKR99928.1 MFS transporter [Sphingomonas sp. CL5.1]